MNTDLLNTLCSDYLTKLEQGKLEPAEQLMAATVLGDMIRRLKNTTTSLSHDLDMYKKLAGADRIIPGGQGVSER